MCRFLCRGICLRSIGFWGLSIRSFGDGALEKCDPRRDFYLATGTGLYFASIMLMAIIWKMQLG